MSTPHPPPAPDRIDSVAGAARDLTRRATALLPQKLKLTGVLLVGFLGGWLGLQHVNAFPERPAPLTAVDRLVPFAPAWIWAYASMWLLTPTTPTLITTRRQLRRYVVGFALITAVAFPIYLVLPTACPRPDPSLWPDGGPYRWLVSFVGVRNSTPSLHASLSLYTLLFAEVVWPGWLSPRGRALARLVGYTWLALILYATLATKQHAFADLPLGLLLGAAGHVAAGRFAPTAPNPAATQPDSEPRP